MKITRCPSCDSNNIKLLTGKLSFKTSKHYVTIPEVTRFKCDYCGEEFFNHAANKVLDQYRGRLAGLNKDKG